MQTLHFSLFTFSEKVEKEKCKVRTLRGCFTALFASLFTFRFVQQVPALFLVNYFHANFDDFMLFLYCNLFFRPEEGVKLRNVE